MRSSEKNRRESFYLAKKERIVLIGSVVGGKLFGVLCVAIAEQDVLLFTYSAGVGSVTGAILGSVTGSGSLWLY